MSVKHGSGKSADTIHLHVGMTDRDVVARVGQILGAKLLGPYAPNCDDGFTRKSQWRVVATGSLCAAWLMTLYPMFGERRRAKAKECLEFWKTLKNSGRRFQPYRISHPLYGTRFSAAY